MDAYHFSPIGFRADILFCNQPYEIPLYETDFLDCDDEKACQTLADIEISMRKSSNMPHQNISAHVFLKKFIHSPYYSRGDMIQNILMYCWLSEEEREECKRLADENSISTLEYVRCKIQSLAAMRYAYVLCLQTLREQADDTSSLVQCLKRLEAISKYADTLSQEEKRINSFVVPVLDFVRQRLDKAKKDETHIISEIKERIQVPARSNILLANVFPGFVERCEPKFGHYSLSTKPHKTADATEAAHGGGAYAPWWTVESCKEAVALEYGVYCRTLNLPEEIRSILLHKDAVQLASVILDELDSALNTIVEKTVPIISSKLGVISWSAKTLLQAEYLCLYRDIMTGKKYRICPICNAIFYVEGRGVTRQYCIRHNRNQIDYYLRRRAAKE